MMRAVCVAVCALLLAMPSSAQDLNGRDAFSMQYAKNLKLASKFTKPDEGVAAQPGVAPAKGPGRFVDRFLTKKRQRNVAEFRQDRLSGAAAEARGQAMAKLPKPPIGVQARPAAPTPRGAFRQSAASNADMDAKMKAWAASFQKGKQQGKREGKSKGLFRTIGGGRP